MTERLDGACSGATPRRRVGGPLVRRYGRALRSPRGVIGLGIIVVITLVAVLTPVLFPQGFDAQGPDALSGPSPANPFGTDQVGRSVFVRSVYGVRADLSLVFLAVPIAAVVGTLLGLIGAVNVAVGTVMQRLFDIVMGFPSLILGISFALVLGAGWSALLVALTVYALPGFGRLARATLLTQQHRDYVLAARMLGVGRGTIMVRHILPHSMDIVITQAVVAAVASIFLESSLSIVGLGIQPPQPSLGVLLNGGARYLEQQPYYVAGPAAILLILVLGFSLLADALNRAGAAR